MLILVITEHILSNFKEHFYDLLTDLIRPLLACGLLYN